MATTRQATGTWRLGLNKRNTPSMQWLESTRSRGRSNLARMRLIRNFFAVACMAWLVGQVRAADPVAPVSPPVPSAYLSRLASARIPAEAAAVVIKPLDGGALSWSANSGKPMNPASTMKLVTTYSALHLLGPAFTFRTEVLSEAPLIGEVLRGDLYVRGGGDPELVVEDLWLLVNRLRGFGIREIRGDVVLDKTCLLYTSDAA